MWSKADSKILPDWLYRTSTVFSDEANVARQVFEEQYGYDNLNLTKCIAFRRTKQASAVFFYLSHAGEFKLKN
jgi:hypothetical protein